MHLLHLLIPVVAIMAIMALSAVVNLGRQVNVIAPFQGVVAGGTASSSQPVGQRNHRINLQCQGIYFSATSGTAYPMTIVKAASASATVGSNTITPTIVGNQITAVTFTAGATASTNFAVGDLVSYQDPTGYGLLVYVATVSGGAIATVNLTGAGASKGSPCPLDPRIMLTSVKQLVNGQVIRDDSPASIIGEMIFNGYIPQTGSLPLIYTEPWRNFLRDHAMNSWDLTGQNTFQIQVVINANVASPSITGVVEFDKFRNARTCTAQNQAYLGNNPATGQPWAINSKVPFLDPIGRHQNTYSIPSGKSDITTLNFSYPITALYCVGATPGNLYGLDIIADGALVLQVTAADMYELYAQYGMQAGNKIYAPSANGGGFNGGLGTLPLWASDRNLPTTIPNGVLAADTGTATNPFPFDLVAKFDVDGRDWEALRVTSSLIFRVYSNISQNITIVTEARPGAYLG